MNTHRFWETSEPSRRPRPSSAPPDATAWEGLAVVVLGLGIALTAASLILRAGQPPATTPASLSGRLVLDGQPVIGAAISLHNQPDQRMVTNQYGGCSFDHVDAGCTTLLVQIGPHRAGYPVQLDPGARRDLGTLPFYRWRPRAGTPDALGPPSQREITVIRP